MPASLTWNTANHIELSDRSSINFKKPLVLKGDGYSIGPAAFALIRHPRWPETKWRQIFKHEAEPVLDTYRRPQFNAPIAQKEVHLPRPPVWGWVCSFRDDYDNRSKRIEVVRLGDVKVATSVTPVQGSPATIEIGTYIGMAIDPTMSVSVMVPWQTAGSANNHADLNQLVDEMAADLSHETEHDYNEINAGLRWIFRDTLPPEAPPGWSFSVEPQIVKGDEGETVRATITVSAPSPGIGAFAMRFASEEDPTLVAVSDFAIVSVAAAGLPPVVVLGKDWDNPTASAREPVLAQ